MKIHPQIIKQGNTPFFVVLQYEEYEELVDAIEESEDRKSIDEFRTNNSEAFPHVVAKEIAEGKNPIKVLREYRQISQVALAKKVNISRQYLNQIENRTRRGNVKVLKQIALALNIQLDLIVE